MKEPIAITGMGVVSPGGNDLESLWSCLMRNKCLAQLLAPKPSEPEVGHQLGCVAGITPGLFLSQRELRRTSRATQLALITAIHALKDAACNPAPEPSRCGVVIGTGFGALETVYASARQFLGVDDQFDRGRMAPNVVPMVMPNASAAMISIRMGWSGPSLTVSTACASGADAIGAAVRLLQADEVDLVIAGGTEAPLVPAVIEGFSAAKALSCRFHEPEAASRPFDRGRDGFVMAEGAGACVLERVSDAMARRAHIHAQIVAYARNSDAYHLVQPAPDGAGAKACMRAAIEDAEASSTDVAFVNAHGTSTVANDRVEIRAIMDSLGSDVPVTANKGVFGHMLGGAGAVETIATALSLEYGKVPPVANFEALDDGLEAAIVCGSPVAVRTGLAIKNSFAFGGHNACLALTAV